MGGMTVFVDSNKGSRMSSSDDKKSQGRKSSKGASKLTKSQTSVSPLKTSPQVPFSTSQSQLQPDTKYSAFTTTKEQSGVLVLTEKPISGKLVSEQLHETTDLKYFL